MRVSFGRKFKFTCFSKVKNFNFKKMQSGSKSSGNLFPRSEPIIKYVQCEGLALMKIVKHCHEESMSNMDIAQGALLGLVVDDRLEITNCFPFPKQTDENGDEEEYQLSMMRKLRRVNVDHFHVGWYQSANVGNFLSVPLLESQFHYQTSIEESVVVVYDNNKTSRGFLTLKAYRLTPQAIEMYKENNFTNESILKLKMGYEHLLVEIPVVVRNSPLINIMLSEITGKVPEEDSCNFLDLGTDSVLEENLRSLMYRVDELNQEAIKFNKYQQAVNRAQQEKYRYIQRKMLENQVRVEKGEQPLPDEDVDKLFKPISAPSRVNPMIVAGQVDVFSKNVSQFCTQSLSKLYTTKALQIAKEAKSNSC